MLEILIDKAKDVYKNNRLINVNLNVIVAAAPAFLAAGVASGMMEHYRFSKEAISIGALVVDLSVFFSYTGNITLSC
jgi:hypothetical protein